MRRLPVLNLRVASPCRVAWDEMQGTDRVRSCSLCDQQVFNISRLTRDEAEALFAAHAGKLCVTYYQRSDGTILLADCTYHEQRGGWLPAIAAGALFGAAVLATPPEPATDAVDSLEMVSGGLLSSPSRFDESLEVSTETGLPIASSLEWHATPIVAIAENGDITYGSELIATAPIGDHGEYRLDALYGRLQASHERRPWERSVAVHAHGATDVRTIDAIVRTVERAGFFPLFAVKK